jgi:asparagine synthase (glutamine-hydrolysing)
MCGICGIVDFDGGGAQPDILARMTASLRHRGPDDTGTWLVPPAGLGHNRLSIIDLSSQGHQPMLSDDGALSLVYNGEIYNFPELRRELEADGAVFRSHSDTELVLRAWQRWGAASLPRLNGMFAFAIWDGANRALHLARDRFGIKPLYLLRTGRTLVFGSEVKAIAASGRLERRVDPQALHEYLYYGAALGEHSLFAGVRKLLPGHRATFDRDGLTIAPYVSLQDVPEVRGSVTEIAEELRQRLDRAVHRHLLSDVPVGLFLSGGVDSSALTAFASRHYAGRLSTFAVAYDFETGEGELPKARLVARQFGTDHHELRITAANLPQVIERLVTCHDEPFGDAADIPLYLLAEKLRGTIKVVLQGDGGDEMFAGYRRYAVLSWEWLWRGIGLAANPLAGLLPRTPLGYRLRRLLGAMGNPDPALRMALLLTDESLASPPARVLSPAARALLAPHDPFARYRSMQERLGHLDPVQRMLHVDASILLPDIYLEKVDKSTMAHALEVRVPFLDNELSAFAMALPSSLKVRHGEKKWILRRALRGILPDSILDAPKTGFNVPYSRWLREGLRPYLESVLLDRATLASGFYDEAALRESLSEHFAGRRDNGFLLWKLLNLQIWSRQNSIHLAG